MAIDYQRMQARTTRMLRQNGATYNVTRKGSVTVIGGVEQKRMMFSSLRSALKRNTHPVR